MVSGLDKLSKAIKLLKRLDKKGDVFHDQEGIVYFCIITIFRYNFICITRISAWQFLPSAFYTDYVLRYILWNKGRLLGLVANAYILIIGGDFNGPSIGGMLTIMGFATFGKHLKNCWPVALGVIAATLLFGKSLAAPGPLRALLFGTTLAPLAGEFGIFVGFAAGFTHLLMVERTAAWHGGLDLYNNGFAGGLTATLFVAVIQWIDSNKKSKIQRQMK